MRVPVLLALLLLVPLARAQGVGVEVDPLPFPIKPLAQTGTAEVRLSAPCGEDVAFTVEPGAGWIDATVEPATLPSPACEGAWQAEATLSVRAAADAPAMEPAPLVVRAHAGQGNASASVEVRAAFAGVLDVQANQTEATVEPQRVATFDVLVTNHGNGIAKVTFEVVHPPGGLAVPTPPSITLREGASATIPLMAQTLPKTGYVNEVGVFTVHVRSAHALHPDQAGDSETLSFTVRTQGAYVPGPAAWLALLGAALILVRRR